MKMLLLLSAELLCDKNCCHQAGAHHRATGEHDGQFAQPKDGDGLARLRHGGHFAPCIALHIAWCHIQKCGSGLYILPGQLPETSFSSTNLSYVVQCHEQSST